jgi:hypothetical protein
MGVVNMLSVALVRASSGKKLIWDHEVERKFVCLSSFRYPWLRIIAISHRHGQFQEVVYGCRPRSSRVR